MSLINERHVDTDRAGDAKGGGNFPSLMDFMNRRKVVFAPFNEADQSANGQFILLNSTDFPGNLAIGTSSTESNGGIVCAQLSGAVGTAATDSINDAIGNITNLVEIREATSHDPLFDGNGRKVYGLLQADSTASDGDAVGAAGSENLQVSFVVVDSSGVMQSTSITETVEFAIPKMYAERHLPTYYKEGSSAEADVLLPSPVPGEPLVRKYVVTSGYAANEVIILNTGAGSISGSATTSGDSISSLGLVSDFNNDNRTRIRVNGEQLTKGTDVVWDSVITFHFSVALDVGDTYEVEVAQ
jgi:hypothetical protein